MRRACILEADASKITVPQPPARLTFNDVIGYHLLQAKDQQRRLRSLSLLCRKADRLSSRRSGHSPRTTERKPLLNGTQTGSTKLARTLLCGAVSGLAVLAAVSSATPADAYPGHHHHHHSSESAESRDSETSHHHRHAAVAADSTRHERLAYRRHLHRLYEQEASDARQAHERRLTEREKRRERLAGGESRQRRHEQQRHESRMDAQAYRAHRHGEAVAERRERLRQLADETARHEHLSRAERRHEERLAEDQSRHEHLSRSERRHEERLAEIDADRASRYGRHHRRHGGEEVARAAWRHEVRLARHEGGLSRHEERLALRREEHEIRLSRAHAVHAAIATHDVVRTAYALRSTRYVFGGTSRSGFDCSGFTRFVLGRSAGVALPRTARDQYETGVHVSRSDLKPGDLVFFKNTYRRGISHVGIYVGNGKFVHAANTRRGVTTDSLDEPYYQHKFAGARRVVGRPL